jgi:hypothetical protein
MAKKFEYKSFSRYDLSEEKLKKLGLEGWEMTGVVPGHPSEGTLYFKREIESPITQKHEQSGYDMGR